MFGVIVWSVSMFAIGYIAGLLRRDVKMYDLCMSQQVRGNYWFDKYQAAINGDYGTVPEDGDDDNDDEREVW